ncbi:hypothetical protein AAC387_Pa06g1082 [Persea americana]
MELPELCCREKPASEKQGAVFSEGDALIDGGFQVDLNFKSHIQAISDPFARGLELAQEKLQGRREMEVFITPIMATKEGSWWNQSDNPPFCGMPVKSNARDVSSCPSLTGVVRKLHDDLFAPSRNLILQDNLAGPGIADMDGLATPKKAPGAFW